jgi:hypothetical protein
MNYKNGKVPVMLLEARARVTARVRDAVNGLEIIVNTQPVRCNFEIQRTTVRELCEYRQIS